MSDDDAPEQLELGLEIATAPKPICKECGLFLDAAHAPARCADWKRWRMENRKKLLDLPWD